MSDKMTGSHPMTLAHRAWWGGGKIELLNTR